jgi:N-acetylglucosaminyldiphosphoundecaprenol N-acetyl-beta-D-mannosaminyltransferase
MLTTPDNTSTRTVVLHGVPFQAISEQETCDWILRGLRDGRGGFVITANLDHLYRSQRDATYRSIMDEASIIVADGMPLIWASRLQGNPLPERVAGSTMCSTLARELGKAQRSLYLLGGNPGVAEQAAEILEQNYPGLRVVGTCCPEFGFDKDPKSMDRILQHLLETQPDMVYVALGSPKQEILISQFRSKLPKTWWMGIGISLSFITGDVKRAPEWMQRIGIEWIHRLSQEPGRLAKRYLLHGVPFAIELLTVSAWKRLRGEGRRGEG